MKRVQVKEFWLKRNSALNKSAYIQGHLIKVIPAGETISQEQLTALCVMYLKDPRFVTKLLERKSNMTRYLVVLDNSIYFNLFYEDQLGIILKLE